MEFRNRSMMDVTNYDRKHNGYFVLRASPSPRNTSEWRMTERTYNKLWQACSERLVPNRPRSSPRRNSCRGKSDRQTPAAACWDRCRRMSTIPRWTLSWQCCSSGSPEVLSIDHRPNTNGRLTASPDSQHRPRTLTKRSRDPPRSQVSPDPLPLPLLVYLRDKTEYISVRPDI